MEKGTLKTNGVHLQEHEFHTVRVLLESGYDVELIPPSQIKGLRMPDIMVQGVPWEMKAPAGDGKKTIQNNVQNAGHQSSNVIIDLVRCGLPQDQALKDIERQYQNSKHIRRMMVVTKEGALLDIGKRRGVS